MGLDLVTTFRAPNPQDPGGVLKRGTVGKAERRIYHTYPYIRSTYNAHNFYLYVCTYGEGEIPTEKAKAAMCLI